MISFSPTGTSRRVAEEIAEVFSNEKTIVDLCEETLGEMQIGKEDICIFSAPCYGGRIPQTAAERLSHIHGEQTPAIVLITFGNRAFEDALLELADSVEKNGFRVIAGCAVSAEHNIMHIFGQGRPDSLDWKEIRRFSNAAVEKINAGETERPLLPGSRPYKEWHGGKPHFGERKDMREMRAVRAEMSREGDFSRWAASERGGVYCLHAMHSAMPPKQQKHTKDVCGRADSKTGRRLPGEKEKRILSVGKGTFESQKMRRFFYE